MLDGNELLRQKRDEVPEGTLSCPDRNMEFVYHYRHYEGLRLLPSACEQINNSAGPNYFIPMKSLRGFIFAMYVLPDFFKFGNCL